MKTISKKEIVYLPIEKVIPDPEQPRKHFDAVKLATLAESIKRYGIKQPLEVYPYENGKYIIDGGERRYRAAIIAKLTEVPVLIDTDTAEEDRLIKQYHMQELHEHWTPSEKAYALVRMSKDLDMTAEVFSKRVGVNDRTIRKYKAFFKITSQKEFVKNEIPLEFADKFYGVQTHFKKVYESVYKEEFTMEMKKKLELELIQYCKEGKLTESRQFTKIKDAVTANPDFIKKILSGKGDTPDTMFLKSNAYSAYHLRNVMNSLGFSASHARRWLESPNAFMTKQQAHEIEESIKSLQKALEYYKHNQAD